MLRTDKAQARLARNVPRTQDNTRVFDSRSYLTADPATLQAAADRAAEASRKVNGEAADKQDDVLMEESEDMPEAGPSRPRASAAATVMDEAEEDDGENPEDGGEADEEEVDEDGKEQAPAYAPPPRILITTSPSPSKETYEFCDDLKGVFPGGEFFKRPKGKGFEMGRVARWAAKRGYGAMIVVNEDHKRASVSSSNFCG